MLAALDVCWGVGGVLDGSDGGRQKRRGFRSSSATAALGRSDQHMVHAKAEPKWTSAIDCNIPHVYIPLCIFTTRVVLVMIEPFQPPSTTLSP